MDGRVKGTKTIILSCMCDVPQSRMKDVTYISRVYNVHNEKKDKNRTRFVVGGDCSNYPGEVATPTAEMLMTKILRTGGISTKGAHL